LKIYLPRPIIKNIKVLISIIFDTSLQKIKDLLSNKVLLLMRLVTPQLSNSMKLENKYFLNIVKKNIYISIFLFHFISKFFVK
jgi:hypothetical protein